MTPYQKRMNSFIQRMAEDMQLRNFSPNTIDAYTYHADKFCQYFGKPAGQLGPEEFRKFQLYLVNEKKVSWSSFNQAVCATVSVHRDARQGLGDTHSTEGLYKGFTPSRSFGGYHSSKRKEHLNRCRALISPGQPDDQATQTAGPVIVGPERELRCPRCEGELVCIQSNQRPSWRQIFDCDIYRVAGLYSPMYHVLSRAPPGSRR